MRKTLFLHPPSYDGFDGGAGSRYQARREIRSFWYPTWLAQPAALVPGNSSGSTIRCMTCPSFRLPMRMPRSHPGFRPELFDSESAT